MYIAQESPTVLDELSALAARSFESTQEAMEAVLMLITDQIGMRTSYLTRITSADERLEVLAAYNAPGGCGVPTGAVLHLPQTYCSAIASAEQHGPLLIEDTRASEQFAGHPALAAFPQIASYVGVPIQLADEGFFGTLCAVDPEARALSHRQADLLVVLARILATQLERDRQLSERRRAEQALRESEQRYRDLVQLSPDTIAVLQAGKILFCNPAGARLLRVASPDALVGRATLDFVHPEHIERVKAYMRQIEGGAQYIPPSEERLVRADGEEVYVELTAIAVPYQGGPAAQVIARDISRRKRAEARLEAALAEQQQANAQLQRLNGAKSHFVSIVSHEFRTALTGIQGFSEMMRDEDFSTEEMKEFAGDINEDARRLNRMITEMLDLDRMESGRMTLHLRTVDLNKLIADVAEQARRTSPQHSLRLQLDQALPAIPADQDKIIQVLTNLVSNAIKYAPGGGEVLIASHLEGETAHLLVRDHGLGIPAGQLDTIFDRYSRVETGEARFIQGTGLGLPISRQIVELHHGAIWAESVQGQGSTFHVTLPLHEPQADS